MASKLNIAARCVIPRLNTLYYYNEDDYKKIIHKLLEYGVSGFCVFGGEVEQVKEMISELRAKATQPLIFLSDMENGLPMRFAGGTGFPHAMALGKTKDPTKTGIAAKLTAKEAKALGINWNLAPVCDINSNRKNPIINIRAYGEDAKTVSEHCVYYIKGTQDEKMIATAKHFPGHGDTDIDSHLEMPILKKKLSELEELEFKPFFNAIKAGVKSVMIAHIAMPELEKKHIPASFSKAIINDLLIEKYNFKGLVISDALEMKSISNHYTSAEATEMFFKAGGHIALMPENPFEAIEHIAKLIETDQNLEDHLSRSYRKLKKEMDFSDVFKPNVMLEDFKEKFMSNERIALQLARDSIELKIKENVIPIEPGIQYAGFAFLQKEDNMRSASMFFNFLQQALQNNCDFGYINEDIDDDDIEQMRIGTAEADVFLFAMFYRSRSYEGNIGIAEKISPIIKRISMGKPVVCIYFGNPYLADEIEAETSIMTYSDSLASIGATTMVVSGKSSNFENTDDTINNN